MLALLIAPVLVTLAVAFGLWPWTAVYHRRPTLRVLTTMIATSTVIVVLQFILGALTALRPVTLMSSAIGIAVLSFAGFWLGGKRLIRTPPDRIARPTIMGVVLGVITVCVYGWIAWIGTLIPPYGWDAIVYHLTEVLHYARSHTVDIFPLIQTSGSATQFFFPKVGELHASWFYILSGGIDESYRVAAYGLMPLALTAAVATRAAAEALGWRLALPWIVPGVLMTPGFVSQPLGLQVDVAFAAFVLSSFAYAIWAEKESRFAHVAFAALSGGLAFGVKVSFLYYFLPIAVVLLSVRAFRTLTDGGLWRAVGRIVLLLVIFLAPCGYWYGRNMIATGNPLWPTKVKVGGVTVFDGPGEIPRVDQITRWYVSSKADWIVRPFSETKRGKSDYTGSGFGAMFAAGYVATLLMLILAVRRKAWRMVRPLLAIPITGAIFVFLSPTGEPRYILAAVGFGVLSLVGLVDVIGRGAGSALDDAKLKDPETTEVHRAPLWIAQSAVTAALVYGALGCLVTAAPQLEMVVSEWRAGTWKPTQYYPVYYGTAGDAFNWLTDHGGSNTTVSFTNGTFIAPLLGWHNRNRVVQATIAGKKRHDIETTEVRTYKEWFDYLQREKVNYVVQWVPWWGEKSDRLTEMWIADNPEAFALVDDFGGRARIFQIVEGATPRTTADAPLDLPQLSSADNWDLEYTSEVVTTVGPDAGGDTRFSYAFTSPDSSYCDWRSIVSQSDWTPYSALTFDLQAVPQPAYLVVYIKGPGGHGSIRFRIDLSKETGERRRVEFLLRRPEKQEPEFELSQVGEVHFVFDNSRKDINPSGELTVSRFRLEPRGAQLMPAENPAAQSGADRSQP